MPLADMNVWILTDGKAGDEAQCVGVAEALGVTPTIHRVAPRKPWVWLMPWGPVDPAEHPMRKGSPLSPPFPDLLIASGRRTVPYVRLIKKLSGNHTFTVFLKDPRTGAGTADLIWVPEHDALHGSNVVRTLTSPHRISRQRLDAARQQPAPWPDTLPRPHAAVLVGGDSKHHRYTQADSDNLMNKLEQLAASGVALLVTPSRRTPHVLRERLARIMERNAGWFWNGEGENPYIALIAHADFIITTADSVNMVGEAVSTGKPVFVFEPSGMGTKIRFFLEKLKQKGVIYPFNGLYQPYTYTPLDSTPEIAEAIVKKLHIRQTGTTGLREH